MDAETIVDFISIVDTIDDAVLVFDDNLHYTFANKKALKIINKKAEEVLGKHVEDVSPGIRHTKSGKALYAVAKTGKPGVWEYYAEQTKQWLRGHGYKTPNGIVVFYADVTESYSLEDSLKEQAKLLDLSFDAIRIQDEHNRISYWNKGAEKLYGWKKDEIIGKIGYEVFGTQFPGGYERFFRQLRKNRHWAGLLHHRAKNNREIIVRSSWSIMEENGKVKILEINRDITEQEAAKQQLMLNEEKFRTLLEHNNDVVVVTDNDMKFLYISPSIKNVLGYTVEEYKRINIQKIMHPDDFAKAMSYRGQVAQSKEAFEFEGVYRIKNKRGEWRYVRMIAENLLADPAVGGFVTTFRDVTRERLAELKREESEKRFRSLIENSSDVIMITNAKGKITYISPSIEKILGYSPEEIINSSKKRYFHPDDVEKTRSNLEKLLTGQVTNTTGQYRVRTKNGEWRWIDMTAKSLLNDPTIQGIVSNFRDITETKIAKQKIEESERRFRSLIENSSDVIVVTNINGEITYVSSSTTKQFGYMPEEILHTKIYDYLYPEDVEQDMKHYKHLISGGDGTQTTGVYRIKDKQGRMRWVETSSTNLIGDPAIHGIVTNIRDITDEKNARQQIVDTQQELEAILTHVPNGVMVQDEEGRLIYVNTEAAKLAGYASRDEMIKAPAFDYIYRFDLGDEYGRKFLVESLPGRVALKSGKNAQATIKFVNKQNGDIRWINITSTVIYRGTERKPLVVNVMQDITEFKEADVRKNDFISMASHELKTPLTSLKVYMHLLLDKAKLDEHKKQEYIIKASDQVEKLQTLVGEMLDQSTIQQGKLSLHLQEMYFDYFVKEYVSNFQQTTDGFKIQLEGQTDSIVTIDKYRIEQVLANLLSNAVKYSKDRKEILVNIKKQGDFVSVSVKDFGMGIPSTEIENIFKPYYRVIGKKENTFPGMGMGLYISKDIIKRHGGEIDVKSTLGKGTTFTIILPTIH